MYKRILYPSLILGVTILLVVGSTASVAQAASLCVHPAGAGGCFSTVQDAVDAANEGDRILIRGGRYIEQVTIIDKDLTLIGQSGAIIQAPVPMEQTLLAATEIEERAVIGVANAEVTIHNLTVDGANSSADNEFLVGFALVNAGGVIRDNLIRNIGFGAPTLPVDPTTGEPLYQGDGILVINLEATARTVTIAKNRIFNFNNNGMSLVSLLDPSVPGPANLTVNVVDNTVAGMGPNDVIDQWGIFLVTETFDGSPPPTESNASGSIQDNHVRDVATVAPYEFPGAGIVTFDTNNLSLADNMIENVNIGITALRSFFTQVVDNNVTGHPPQAVSTGLELSGSDIQVTENRFKRFGLGMYLFVEDPIQGSTLNTSLTDNRFEDIGVDVLTSPGAPEAAAARAAPNSSKWQRYRPQASP